jgi:hypothetical protein
MRSVGATIWIHFSKSDRSAASVEPFCFHYTKNFWVLFNTEEFHKRCFRFQTAFYNNGYVKDLPVFQFFQTLDGGNFGKIKRVFSAKSKEYIMDSKGVLGFNFGFRTLCITSVVSTPKCFVVLPKTQ